MSNLERAIILACEAHSGQNEKNGMPYILHPLRLMMKMDTESEKIAAILHDIVEDTDFSIENLRDEGFSNEVLDAVFCLSRKEDDTYDEYIEKIERNPIALKVKISDLEDNMNIRRIIELTEKDLKRIKKYHKVWLELTNLQRDERWGRYIEKEEKA